MFLHLLLILVLGGDLALVCDLLLAWSWILARFQQRYAAFLVGRGDCRVLLVLELEGADRGAR